MLYCVDDQQGDDHGVQRCAVDTGCKRHGNSHHNSQCNRIGYKVSEDSTDCHHQEQEDSGADVLEEGRKNACEPGGNADIGVGNRRTEAHYTAKENEGAPVDVVESVLESKDGLAVFKRDQVKYEESDQRRIEITNLAEYRGQSGCDVFDSAG